MTEYQTLRAKGLCCGCGRPSLTAYCPECKAKRNARERARYHRQTANGICVRCGKPARKGMIHCFACGLQESNRKNQGRQTAC